MQETVNLKKETFSRNRAIKLHTELPETFPIKTPQTHILFQQILQKFKTTKDIHILIRIKGFSLVDHFHFTRARGPKK